MPWWAWIIIGALLFGAELTFIDAQFYLVFVGIAALLVGMIGLGGVVLPDWLQWLVFAAASIASMALFRRRIYEFLRKNTANVNTGPAGEEVLLAVDLPPGESCRLEYRGTNWTARNDGDQIIPAGSKARIVRLDGLTLQIRHTASHST